jgi:branched-chain amino acid transport system ATP-binding protein
VLNLTSVQSGYHGLEILHDVSLSVGAAEVVAIVGANGAGKSTTLKTIAGEVKQYGGTISFDGTDISNASSHDLARRGLMLVPEYRALFGTLTVEENLTMGLWGRDGRDGFSGEEILSLFPILKERRSQLAQTMSGGEQQMLAIGRALMGAPKLLMLDEPSTGLSPKYTWTVFDAIHKIRERGVSILLVEQNAGQVLELADRAYVMESGTMVLSGTGQELARDARVQAAYLGG